jgi:hypothetical protein
MKQQPTGRLSAHLPGGENGGRAFLVSLPRVGPCPRGCAALILSHSIFMISAPKAPSQRVAHGPARTQLKSTGECFQGLAVETSASFSCIAVSLSYGAGGR